MGVVVSRNCPYAGAYTFENDICRMELSGLMRKIVVSVTVGKKKSFDYGRPVSGAIWSSQAIYSRAMANMMMQATKLLNGDAADSIGRY